MKKRLFHNTIFLYTVTFLILLPVIFYPFLAEGRSFVWETDGMNQHLPVLIYYGQLLRDLLSGKGFPMVDFRIGMGFDTITTIHYYALGDPIALLAVFMTVKNAVIVYNLLILLRFYLTGLSFLAFCRYWGRQGTGVVLGAIMYVYSGYSLYSGVRHPYFMNPLIYLPLLLIGMEEVLRRKKPYLLIGMTFISAISNFYFFYILTVIVVLYVIFRYLTVYRKEMKWQVIGFFFTGLRTGAYYLMGAALSAVVFVPVIYGFLQNGRMESEPKLLTSYLFYNRSYYLYTLQSVFAPGVSSGYWIHLYFSVVTAISVTIVLCRRQYATLRIAFLLTFCALLVPAFGYFMNGFSYLTNRWDFLFAFLVAFVFATTYEDIFQLGPWEKSLLSIGVVGYGVLACIFPAEDMVRWVFIILLSTVLIIIFLQTGKLQKQKRLQGVILYLLVIITLGFNGYVFYARDFNGYSTEFLTGEEVETYTNNNGILSLLQEIEDEDFYRIENYGDDVRNEALYLGFHDVSAYYSLMDGNVTNFFKQLEFREQKSAYRFDNQDARTIPDALACVKYFITNNTEAAPYGYELKNKIIRGGKTYYLYENLYALPLGYIYDEYMLEKDYETLSSLEKQNALMYAVILEKESAYAKPASQDMSIGIEQLNYKEKSSPRVIVEDDRIKVLKPRGTIRLEFDARRETETYVRFLDLSIDKRDMVSNTFAIKGEGETTKRLNFRNIYHNSYFGKRNFLVCTGYSEEGQSQAKITFPKKETYSYDSIEVYHLNMNYYRERIQELRADTLQNIRVSDNRIEGDVSLGQKGIMVFSIPYGRGWTGYVDGQKTELLRGNVMYTALQLSEGEHHIVLEYQTPFLLQGILISAAGILILIGIVYWQRHQK